MISVFLPFLDMCQSRMWTKLDVGHTALVDFFLEKAILCWAPFPRPLGGLHMLLATCIGTWSIHVADLRCGRITKHVIGFEAILYAGS